MKDLCIICSVIPSRYHLLRRSLQTWQNSITASGLDADICIWSEGAESGDFIETLPGTNNLHIAGQEAFSGSPEVGSNFWTKNTEAKVYLLLHPEIMLTTDAVRVAFDNAKPNVYCSFRIYWIPQHMTEHLDNYNWNPPEQLEHYSELKQNNIRVREDAWESDTCYSLDYATAKKTFPVPVFGFWGGIDPYLAGVRRHLSITTFNPPNPQYHQSHKKIEGRGPGEAVNAAANELINRFGSV